MQTPMYAGFTLRFFAQLLDMLVIACLMIVAFLLSALLGSDNGAIVSVISVLIMISGVFYFVYFTSEGRQTLGKRALGIKVVKLEGNPALTMKEAFCREILFRSACNTLLGLGYMWVIWDTRKQGWHDKIAGTAVIRV